MNINRFNEFKHHSYNLYRSMIMPVSNLLGNKRLIIIPDGLLGYLPFDLLIEYDFVTDEINYRDLPYLITNHPISYSYSATLRYNSFFNARNKKLNNNTLAFAPIYNDNINSVDSNSIHLENLPFAKVEVLNIINDQEGTAYYDRNATKNNFLKHAGSNDILHLAMHTIINDSLPMQSKLVFYDDENDSTS
jgi:CHAT domain-containing protein